MADPQGMRQRFDGHRSNAGGEITNPAEAHDVVELTTVGIDIGSTTSHLMFALVVLQRLTQDLSSRFVPVHREVLWRSPVTLTPYSGDGLIDATELSAFVRDSYVDARMNPGDVDSGAVILTGLALHRRNARAIADLFAGEGGRFVTASAGHHLEAVLAAHGSGAVRLSHSTPKRLLNIDIGGGTTKFTLLEQGRILGTAALALGGRLVTWDAAERIVNVEPEAQKIAGDIGLTLHRGQRISAADRQRMAAAFAAVLASGARLDMAGNDVQELLLTPPLPSGPPPDLLVFSGGVAEYFYGRAAEERFDDLGGALAAELRSTESAGLRGKRILQPAEVIRATVIGASQFTVEVSGNTVFVSAPDVLPLRNVPVARFECGASDVLLAAEVETRVRRAVGRVEPLPDQPTALWLGWAGAPEYSRLRALAAGIAAGMPTVRNQPLVVLTDGDIGRTLGRILTRDLQISRPVISLDGLQLKELDFVDIGEPVQPTNVVPVVVKSLLFGEV
ncbi:MAG: ethanolamine ammonia-lyase reactivating factor EutA [Carbonactinosporaceae bacterium]